MEAWHYQIGGTQHGPVSATEVIRLHHSKRISRSDLVWHQSLPAWRPLSEAWPLVKQHATPVPAPTPAEDGDGLYRVLRFNRATDIRQHFETMLNNQAKQGWRLDRVVESASLFRGEYVLVVFRRAD